MTKYRLLHMFKNPVTGRLVTGATNLSDLPEKLLARYIELGYVQALKVELSPAPIVDLEEVEPTLYEVEESFSTE